MLPQCYAAPPPYSCGLVSVLSDWSTICYSKRQTDPIFRSIANPYTEVFFAAAVQLDSSFSLHFQNLRHHFCNQSLSSEDENKDDCTLPTVPQQSGENVATKLHQRWCLQPQDTILAKNNGQHETNGSSRVEPRLQGKIHF